MRSIFVILIGVAYHSFLVFNKDSCRLPGSILKTIALCKICNEYVSWICRKCNKINEFKHFNYFCTTGRLDLKLRDSNPFEMVIIR